MGNLLSGVTLNIAEGTSDNLIFSMLSKICPILTMGFGKSFDFYFESQTNFKFTFYDMDIKGRFKFAPFIKGLPQIHSFLSVCVR